MPEDQHDEVHALRLYVDEFRREQDAEIGSLRESLSVNTALTTEIKLDVASLRTATQPVIDAMETMEAGIRTLGRIGRFGERFGRVIMFAVALTVVVKFILGGASWRDVAAAFQRITGH